MKTIYIDIGSRGGQQIEWALRSVDYAYGFEPSPLSYDEISRIFANNPKVILHPFGLWNQTCKIEMFNEGAAGGTIFRDYYQSKKGKAVQKKSRLNVKLSKAWPTAES
ncbi:hypothetical protein LCGC14_1191010 [marine sediment metagenome]|uniref:Uncharacterized protein n=1 Tax=marine sediment metagenome TaxID=412755 RepID=A0A0F9P222_9ZZZZ